MQAFIKQCYYSGMRFYRDRPDVIVPGRWYFCPPGAKALPFFQRFDTYRTDPGPFPIDPLIGEVPVYGGKARNEILAGYDGQHWCGSLEDWQQGLDYSRRGSAPVDQEGVPLCCSTYQAPPGGGSAYGTGYTSEVGGGSVSTGQDGTGCVYTLGALNRNDYPDTLFAWVEDVAGDSGIAGVYPLVASSPPHDFWSLPHLIGPANDVNIVFGAFPAVGGNWGVLMSGGDFGATTLESIECRAPSPLAFEPTIFGPYFPDFDGLVRVTVIQNFDVSGTAVSGGGLVDLSEIGGSAVSGGGLVDGGFLDMTMTGSLIPFAGSLVPTGYLACDGVAYNAVDFPELFGVIGTSWGDAGPGTFKVPDLRDRVVIGTSPGALDSNRPTARALAEVGGEETHQLTVVELANHAHSTISGDNFSTATGLSAVNAPGFPAGSDSGDNLTDVQGSDQPHNTMQPFAVVVWIIKT